MDEDKTKLFSILIIVLIFFVLFTAYPCHDNTMRPGIGEGDLVLTYNFDRNYTSNSLIIIKAENKYHVRRIVATAGDTIDISNNHLYINGEKQLEEYCQGRTYAYRDGVDFPITLNKGELFVLADNRENAEDSRAYGPVTSKMIKGVVLVVLRHRGL